MGYKHPKFSRISSRRFSFSKQAKESGRKVLKRILPNVKNAGKGWFSPFFSVTLQEETKNHS